MRSIFVRVEPTVRLVRVGEGVEDSDTLISPASSLIEAFVEAILHQLFR
jgi:hypothetical protein